MLLEGEHIVHLALKQPLNLNQAAHSLCNSEKSSGMVTITKNMQTLYLE